MIGLAWAVLGLVGMFLFAALGDLVSEEIRGWLDMAPCAILHLAAARLAPELRESTYQEEWLPELIYVLRGAESRPITRLIRGTTFAVGLFLAARRIAQHRVATEATLSIDNHPWQRIILEMEDGSMREFATTSVTSALEFQRDIMNDRALRKELRVHGCVQVHVITPDQNPSV
jgi:hypothetical protein